MLKSLLHDLFGCNLFWRYTLDLLGRECSFCGNKQVYAFDSSVWIDVMYGDDSSETLPCGTEDCGAELPIREEKE